MTAQTLRVTDDMRARQPLHFTRLLRGREPGQVHEQRARLVSRRGLHYEWIEHDDIFRPARAGELEELQEVNPGLQVDMAKLPQEDTSFDPVPVQPGDLLAELQRKEATAVCGCVEQPGKVAKCSDEQEPLCEYGPANLPLLKMVRARTQVRPATCPRRLAYEREREQGQDAVRARCSASKIPATIAELLIGPRERVQLRPAVAQMRAWNDSGERFLVLCGTNQIGKSTAAAGWLAWRCTAGLFVTAHDIAAAVRPDPQNAAYELLRLARKAPNLVIDNVDGDESDAVKREIEALIVKVHEQARRCIITCSMSREDFLRMWVPAGAETSAAHARLTRYGWVVEVPACL